MQAKFNEYSSQSPLNKLSPIIPPRSVICATQRSSDTALSEQANVGGTAVSSLTLLPTFTMQTSAESIEVEAKDEQSEQLKTPPITGTTGGNGESARRSCRSTLSSGAITGLLHQSSPGHVSPMSKRLMTKRWERTTVSQPAAPAQQHTTTVAGGNIGGEAAVQGAMAVQGGQQAQGRMRSKWRSNVLKAVESAVNSQRSESLRASRCRRARRWTSASSADSPALTPVSPMAHPYKG